MKNILGIERKVLLIISRIFMSIFGGLQFLAYYSLGFFIIPQLHYYEYNFLASAGNILGTLLGSNLFLILALILMLIERLFLLPPKDTV